MPSNTLLLLEWILKQEVSGIKRNYFYIHYKKGNNVIISIKDNGIGIPKEEIPNLFKKFTRGSNARDMYTDGSGLGLFVVKEIIEGHYGKVWIESKLDKGTTFFVSLPVYSFKEINIKEHIIND